MSDDLTRFVGAIPEHYDRRLGPVMFEPYARLMAQRVAAEPVARLMETAAGTGIVTRRLRDALPANAQIVATDLNAPMLDIAKGKFAAGENVEFQTADAQALPFADAAFDAVCCQFGVMFMPDKAKAYAEARRVLKPGGRFLFSVWDSQSANPFTGVVLSTLRGRMSEDLPNFFDTPFGMHALDPVRDGLHEAGFPAVAIEVAPVVAPFDAKAFAEGVALGSPFADQVRARGVEPASLAPDLAEGFARAFPSGTMPLRAILFTAHAPTR